MKDITWELKNLDSLKEYIFDELIGEHKNTKDINEAINKYAERYYEMQLKLLGLSSVMSSLNIDIRLKAQKHLKGYYGSNDSRAFEECHIDHYTQGYKQAEKDIIRGHNEA